MPYLRITGPALPIERRAVVAARLSDAVNDLFADPGGRVNRDELRERTTIHFTPYAPGELFVGGRTPEQRDAIDLTVELSDWSMSVRTQRRVAARLTPLLAELYGVPPDALDGINMRFHSYPPTHFAVGGRLLADLVPRAGQIAKRLFS